MTENTLFKIRNIEEMKKRNLEKIDKLFRINQDLDKQISVLKFKEENPVQPKILTDDEKRDQSIKDRDRFTDRLKTYPGLPDISSNALKKD